MIPEILTLSPTFYVLIKITDFKNSEKQPQANHTTILHLLENPVNDIWVYLSSHIWGTKVAGDFQTDV